MSTLNTKGQLEAEISKAMIEYQRNLMGRGPGETRTYIIEDMVMVRMKGVLTREEDHLARSDVGKRLVKEMRMVLKEMSGQELDQMIERITGCQVRARHSDISTRTGEKIEIYVLDRDLGAEIARIRCP